MPVKLRAMKTRFVSVDREQPLLLPPDLRDWIPQDDLVHFVIQAVEGLDLATFKVNVKGSGSAQYSPHMMLSLLIYYYADGIFSSRRTTSGPAPRKKKPPHDSLRIRS